MRFNIEKIADACNVASASSIFQIQYSTHQTPFLKSNGMHIAPVSITTTETRADY